MKSALATIKDDAAQATDPRQRILDLIEGGITIQKLVIETGVMRAQLQPWLDGKGVRDIDERMAAYLEELDRAGSASPSFVRTPTAERITQAFEAARERPSIALIYGACGLGKTLTAQRYVQSDKARGAVFIAAGEFTKTPTAVLEAIADALEINGSAYRQFRLAKRISDELGQLERALIIVDEAQHLSAAALDALRWFYDSEGFGLAYLGNEFVYTRISRGANRAKFAQLHSRVGFFVHLDRPSEKDVDEILAAWGVRGREERVLAHAIANQPGGLRDLCEHVLEPASRLAKKRRCPIHKDLLQAVADARGLGI